MGTRLYYEFKFPSCVNIKSNYGGGNRIVEIKGIEKFSQSY